MRYKKTGDLKVACSVSEARCGLTHYPVLLPHSKSGIFLQRLLYSVAFKLFPEKLVFVTIFPEKSTFDTIFQKFYSGS